MVAWKAWGISLAAVALVCGMAGFVLQSMQQACTPQPFGLPDSCWAQNAWLQIGALTSFALAVLALIGCAVTSATATWKATSRLQ